MKVGRMQEVNRWCVYMWGWQFKEFEIVSQIKGAPLFHACLSQAYHNMLSFWMSRYWSWAAVSLAVRASTFGKSCSMTRACEATMLFFSFTLLSSFFTRSFNSDISTRYASDGSGEALSSSAFEVCNISNTFKWKASSKLSMGKPNLSCAIGRKNVTSTQSTLSST